MRGPFYAYFLIGGGLLTVVLVLAAQPAYQIFRVPPEVRLVLAAFIGLVAALITIGVVSITERGRR